MIENCNNWTLNCFYVVIVTSFLLDTSCQPWFCFTSHTAWFSCTPRFYWVLAWLEYNILATRMAVAHGSVGEFDSSKETWPSYTERLEQYFIANDLTDEGKKKAVFLSNCGATTYQLIRDLVAPKSPAWPTAKTCSVPDDGWMSCFMAEE